MYTYAHVLLDGQKFYIHTYMYNYACMYTCTYVHVLCKYVSIYIHMYNIMSSTCTCIYMYICVYIYVHVLFYTYVHTLYVPPIQHFSSNVDVRALLSARFKGHSVSTMVHVVGTAMSIHMSLHYRQTYTCIYTYFIQHGHIKCMGRVLILVLGMHAHIHMHI